MRRGASWPAPTWRRLISAAPFRDRVVHHALVAVIEPLFEPRFIGDSYANRVGKGTHHALDRCQQFARSYPYVLQCDIRQFFPSIDHAILRADLASAIGDEEVMRLIDLILEGGAGVLDGDQFVKRTLRCRPYLRYVDDFLLFADDKATLHTWRGEIIARLAGRRLTLHEGRAQVCPTESGIPFLGFRVFPDHRRLRSCRGHAAHRRLRRLARQCMEGRLAYTRLTISVRAWVAHAAHANTWGLRRDVLGRLFPRR